ncbi:MAG: DUF4054 domain-containing protein [Candidatus Adiutrix sp.]|jgi:hypothetical protein|nr:DUF4054 domain-containing protein [Candidatus Adiutrix sp.]
MAAVVFNPDDFREDFPQFADPVKYTERRLTGAFNAATLGLDNTESSPVPYDPDKKVFTRETLLYYLTCHILTLAEWAANGQAGPVTNASEGSVSAGFAAPPVTDKSYFMETPCGRTFWQVSLPYRMGGKYYPVKPYHPWG